MKSIEINNTTADDIPYIEKYLTSWYRDYHDVNLSELIEKSYICVSHRKDGEALSLVSMDDFPPVLSIPKDIWLEWTRRIYHCPYLSYKNALFIHLLAWSSKCERFCLHELLVYIYEHYCYVQHILLIMPQHRNAHSSILEHFKPMRKLCHQEDKRFSLTFYVNSRSWTLPTIEVEPAVISQADYILEILAQKQSKALTEYAPQLSQELNGLEDSEHRLRLVALKEDVVVGFMILDNRVDIDHMREYFDLSLYIEPTSSPLDQVVMPHGSSFNTLDQVVMSHGSSFNTLDNDLQVENSSDKSHVESSIEEVASTTKVFAIVVFAVDNAHEYVIPVMLDAAFKKYCSDFDLCVASTKSSLTCSLFKFMNHIVLKPNILYPTELYALSKPAALGNISVRTSTMNDIENIEHLLVHYEEKVTIVKDLIACLICPDENTTYKMVTICVDKNIIGFTLISSDVNFQYITSHYHINQVTNYDVYHHYDQAVIKYFVLSVPFLSQGRFVLKEILRYLELSCLHYFHNVTDVASVTPEIIHLMFPIRPCALRQYPAEVQDAPTAFYFINKKMTSMLQATNHVRAVVVGATALGISFLGSLIFDRTPNDPCYTRLSIITKHGIWQKPHKYQTLVESVMVHDGETVWNQVASMGLDMWVTVRRGILTEVNVQEKYAITHNNEFKINYEYLFIVAQLWPLIDPGCRMEVQKDIETSSKTIQNDEIDVGTTRREAFKKFVDKSKNNPHGRCEDNLDTTEMQMELDEDPKENVFSISNIVNVAAGMDYVEQMLENREHVAPILIIGKTLGAIACVHAVLSLGVQEAGYEVILIQSERDSRMNSRFSVLNNIDVTRAVMRELNTSQVTLIRNVTINDYNISHGRVTWVNIETAESLLIKLKCSAVFVFEPAILEKHLYMAMRQAKVLVQQKILINASYCTSQPCIFAAGASSKYISSLFAEDTKYCSSIEIGQDLSRKFRIIQHCDNNDGTNQYEHAELTKYKRSIVEVCVLPGGYNYLHVYKPGKRSNAEYAKPGDNYKITTGKISAEDSSGYYQLIFNKCKILMEITCVSRRPIHIAYTVALYGKHAGLLNNIIERHNAAPIPDLYAFFDQPWASALYHSKFNNLLDSISNLFLLPNEDDVSMRSILETLIQQASLIKTTCRGSDTAQVARNIRQAFADFVIFNNFSLEKLLDTIVDRVINFLRANAEELPMYASVDHASDRKIIEQSSDSESYGYSGLPERGYHLPGTLPVLSQELACLLARQDSTEETPSEQDKLSDNGSGEMEGYKKSEMVCHERDLFKSLREKKVAVEDRGLEMV